MIGSDPETAVGVTAVDTLAGGGIPLAGAVLVLLLQVLGSVLENGAEGDLVETALGRPLLLVLHGGGYEAREAVGTVAVAWDLDEIAGRELIQARYAFSVVCIWLDGCGETLERLNDGVLTLDLRCSRLPPF